MKKPLTPPKSEIIDGECAARKHSTKTWELANKKAGTFLLQKLLVIMSTIFENVPKIIHY